jgi:hypothetical protein
MIAMLYFISSLTLLMSISRNEGLTFIHPNGRVCYICTFWSISFIAIFSPVIWFTLGLISIYEKVTLEKVR